MSLNVLLQRGVSQSDVYMIEERTTGIGDLATHICISFIDDLIKCNAFWEIDTDLPHLKTKSLRSIV